MTPMLAAPPVTAPRWRPQFDEKPELKLRMQGLDPQKRAVVAETLAAQAAAKPAVDRRFNHLIVEYTEILPGNPRLIKRVAEHIGMLLALRDYNGHDEPTDVIYRAAIVMVRFPTLVDELLNDTMLAPSASVGVDDATPLEKLWRRPDVRQVVGSISAVQLARCYGREVKAEGSVIVGQALQGLRRGRGTGRRIVRRQRWRMGRRR